MISEDQFRRKEYGKLEFLADFSKFLFLNYGIKNKITLADQFEQQKDRLERYEETLRSIEEKWKHGKTKEGSLEAVKFIVTNCLDVGYSIEEILSIAKLDIQQIETIGNKTVEEISEILYSVFNKRQQHVS